MIYPHVVYDFLAGHDAAPAAVQYTKWRDTDDFAAMASHPSICFSFVEAPSGCWRRLARRPLVSHTKASRVSHEGLSCQCARTVGTDSRKTRGC